MSEKPNGGIIIRDMFLVYFKSNKDGKKEDTPSAICPSHVEAIEFCNSMKKGEK